MKTCFKCKNELPLDNFYAHKKMSSGLLGKCKKCTKADVFARIEIKKRDPQWVIKERERCRIKQEKYRQIGRAHISQGLKKQQVNKRYKEKHPEKINAHKKCAYLKKQPCCVCGNPNGQKHHEDYSKPMEVIWLCSKHHAERHVEIRNNQTINLLTK